MENSKIAWTDHTFNPWIGCEKVSPGCENCYAEAFMDKRLKRVKWGAERKRTSTGTWNEPVKWNAKAMTDGALGDLPRVFCGSLCDWLDPDVPSEWKKDLARLMKGCTAITWLALTKRVESFGHGFAVTPNVWLGVTCENQRMTDKRLTAMRRIPRENVAHRFVSFEPLLGPIKLEPWMGEVFDWAIIGGESGANHREMDLVWLADLAKQCMEMKIPTFIKQDSGRESGMQGRLSDALISVRELPKWE